MNKLSRGSVEDYDMFVENKVLGYGAQNSGDNFDTMFRSESELVVRP